GRSLFIGQVVIYPVSIGHSNIPYPLPHSEFLEQWMAFRHHSLVWFEPAFVHQMFRALQLPLEKDHPVTDLRIQLRGKDLRIILALPFPDQVEFLLVHLSVHVSFPYPFNRFILIVPVLWLVIEQRREIFTHSTA